MAGGNLGTIWTEFRLRLGQLQSDINQAVAQLRGGSADMERYIAEAVRNI
jgi:hypothetical protein